MFDLVFGDICMTDLSKSLNSPKTYVAPALFVTKEEAQNGVTSYCFCRIGKKPVKPVASPFIETTGQTCLRNNSVIYPTQITVISNETGILRKIGTIDDEQIKKQILAIREKEKREMDQALVMALCTRCRREFLLNPSTTIKRLDPFSAQEHQCDYCQIRNGHTYIILKRKQYGDGVK